MTAPFEHHWLEERFDAAARAGIPAHDPPDLSLRHLEVTASGQSRQYFPILALIVVLGLGGLAVGLRSQSRETVAASRPGSARSVDLGVEAVWPSEHFETNLTSAEHAAREFAHRAFGESSVDEADGTNGPTWVNIHIPGGATIPVLAVPVSGQWVLTQVGNLASAATRMDESPSLTFTTPLAATRGTAFIRVGDATKRIPLDEHGIRAGAVRIDATTTTWLLVFQDENGNVVGAEGRHGASPIGQ